MQYHLTSVLSTEYLEKKTRTHFKRLRKTPLYNFLK